MSTDEKPTKKQQEDNPRGGLKMHFDTRKMSDEDIAKMIELAAKALNEGDDEEK